MFSRDQRVMNSLKDLMRVLQSVRHTSLRLGKRKELHDRRPFLTKQLCVVQSFRLAKEEEDAENSR